MFDRLATAAIRQRLGFSPAVAILGPRQVGKTTLAKQIAAEFKDSVYLDLESPEALAPFSEPTVSVWSYWMKCRTRQKSFAKCAAKLMMTGGLAAF
jgi:deoxyadenosine/deoxycytidine kinase